MSMLNYQLQVTHLQKSNFLWFDKKRAMHAHPSAQQGRDYHKDKSFLCGAE